MAEPEMSAEMKAALAILRDDKIIQNTAAAREDNKALLARLDARDAADAERWGKWEAGQKASEPVTPENDPEPQEGVPPAPPAVPEPAPKAKKRGIWFAGEDDKEEG